MNEARVYSPDPMLKRPLFFLREMMADFYACRELASRLLSRNIKAQYRQTYLGYLWAFLPPVLTAAVFILLQKNRMMDSGHITIPYLAFAFCGTILWQAFADAVQAPLRLINQSKVMLAKINFPREALLLAAMGEVIFNYLMRLLPLMFILAWQGIWPSWTWIPAQFFVLGLILCGFAAGLLMSPAGLLFQDVERIIPMTLPLLILLSGVVTAAPSTGMLASFMTLNPLVPLIEVSRNLFTGQPAGPWILSLCIILGIFITFTLGLVLYRLALPHIIDRIPA